jgi:hypothetical protein
LGALSIVGLLVTRPAHGAVVTNIVVPIAGTLVNPCNGEPVLFTGNLHTLFAVTLDPNGGFHLNLHENGQGISGTGVVTGLKYQIPVASHTGFFEGAPLPVVETITETFEMISQGNTQNFYLKFLFHITINANGVVTVDKVDFDTACRG